MKVRIFRYSDSSILETQINEWLQKVTPTIFQVSQSECTSTPRDGQVQHTLTITVFYQPAAAL